jgi:Na+-translocating ferredoxin:NAD+ oxidoreductase RnfG subunit
LKKNSWKPVALAASSLAVGSGILPAYAEIYLTPEQAQKTLYPGAALSAMPLELTEAQQKLIEEKSGVRVRTAKVRLWKSPEGGWFVVDDVLGKHEFITFAAAFKADGSIAGVEILEYRETYGHEIKQAAWRAQFTGKTVQNALKLDEDIKNISGATLSCRHLTDGLKRLIWTIKIAGL